MSYFTRGWMMAGLSCAACALLSTASAQNNFLDDGNVKALAKDGDAQTTHAFAKPGDYLVRVERANARGEKAVGRLWVKVGR